MALKTIQYRTQGTCCALMNIVLDDNKIYDVDDYATRMDRIKAEIMPELANNTARFENEYRDNKLSSFDLSGLNNNLYNMPYGQYNYTRPYANYGEYNYSDNKFPSDYNKSLNDELAQLEYATFGTNFSNDDTSTRIKRLNSVSKAKKSSSKYDDNKFSQRMSTVMEIGAMLLMILAMVL